eukprot:TRINITY_DN8282_c0_g1_i1.p1 TRINITY_DN8282_c0_g1~~TRINITY_DN8282_c0_g1_i1.p1  ORF type:complete len:105 (-),score=19.67 TRINITY_DN8282_c0_g1_i1:85-399(-)
MLGKGEHKHRLVQLLNAQQDIMLSLRKLERNRRNVKKESTKIHTRFVNRKINASFTGEAAKEDFEYSAFKYAFKSRDKSVTKSNPLVIVQDFRKMIRGQPPTQE